MAAEPYIASNYKLCYSGDIQKVFELLRKQNDDAGSGSGSGSGDILLSAEMIEKLATLEMTLKRWKTPTGFYTVLKYTKSPLQSMYSAQNVTQQLAQDLTFSLAENMAGPDLNSSAIQAIQGRGLFRSVVINDIGNIVAFSPPKTVQFHSSDSQALEQTPSLTPAFEIEDFVEGTMINLFYNPKVVPADNTPLSATQLVSGWEISTKGAVGGSIFVPAPAPAPAPVEKTEKTDKKHTFRELFLNACVENGIELDKLDTRFCYSLVLQHPKNPLICHIIKPRIYLISIYSIDNDTLTVTRHPRSTIDWKTIGFNVPRAHSRAANASFQSVCTHYADPSGSTPYRIMGVMFNARNGAGWSFKLRNPTYEKAKSTPSESGKRQLFEYCNLRRTREILTHLKLFPDDDAIFKEFQSRIAAYTQLLYTSYVECFITKKQPLVDYAAHLRTHMYRMHNEIYKPRRLATVDAKTKVGLKFQDANQYVNLVMTPTDLFHALTA
jgi:hypothetical protein